jgi:hypothetical protein
MTPVTAEPHMVANSRFKAPSSSKWSAQAFIQNLSGGARMLRRTLERPDHGDEHQGDQAQEQNRPETGEQNPNPFPIM